MITVHIITNGDKERLQHTIHSLQQYKYKWSYTVHTFPRHKTNGRIGCFLSHIKLFRYAKKHQLSSICIAEDNICSAGVTENECRNVMNDVSLALQSSTWEIIYLGGWITNPCRAYKSTTYPTLYETHATHGTSFYIIHKRLYERILSRYKNYITDTTCEHIDNVINELAYTPYVCVPLLFHRDTQIKSTNLYFSNPIINNLLGTFHYYYRSRYIIRFLQQCALYWKQILFLFLIVVGIIIYFLFKVFSQKVLPQNVLYSVIANK